MAPHLIRPMRFVLPLGAGRALARGCCGSGCSSTTISAGGKHPAGDARASISSRDPLGAPLKRRFATASNIPIARPTMRGSSCSTRVDAAERGADIRTRTRCVRAERGDEWRLMLERARPARRRDRARPGQRRRAWVGTVAETRAAAAAGAPACGSTRAATSWCGACSTHDRGYIFQAADGRVVFALPFAARLHADRHHRSRLRRRSGDASRRRRGDRLSLRRRERIFPRHDRARRCGVGVCRRARALRRRRRSKPQDIAARICAGARRAFGEAPLLTVYGGKITTYRRLAEAALDRLAHFFGARPAWTARRQPAGRRFSGRWRRDAGRAKRARAWPFLSATMRGAWCAPMARASTAFSERPRARRPRAALRRRSHGRRGALPDGAGMGADRRRRAVAAQQARPALSRRRTRAAGEVHGRGCRPGGLNDH